LNHGEGDHDGRCRVCLDARPKAAKKKLTRDVEALARSERRWDARRRDPRVNGADLYVVRVCKGGTGAAKPCWRCVRWCAWSGVKRIFHWDPVVGRFEVLKVNGAEGADVYETSSDARLFAGAVC
jgi:hypothetical protein